MQTFHTPTPTPARTRTVDLDHDQMLIVEDRAGTRIDVYYGGLWLTEERQSQDRFVTSSTPARIESPGRAIAQAIGRTRAHIVEPARELSTRGWRQVLRLPPRLNQLVTQAGAVVVAVVLSLGLPEVLLRHKVDGGLAAPVHAAAASWTSGVSAS